MAYEVENEGLKPDDLEILKLFGSEPYPVLMIDVEEFEHFLDDTDWTTEQKHQYLLEVWKIVRPFILLGNGAHPIQQAAKSCGKQEEKKPKTALTAPIGVEYSSGKISETYRSVVDAHEDRLTKKH
ncbi:MAG: hypothetical protein AAFX54_17820 [Pseudomonadota bacterium]